MLTRCLFSAVVALVMVAPTSAQTRDESRVELGSLTCRIDGGASFVFGSTRSLSCKFESVSSREPEYYEGEIERFGLDLGVTGETVMGWAVFAPTRGLPDHALAGTYTGVAADASSAWVAARRCSSAVRIRRYSCNLRAFRGKRVSIWR